MTGQEDASRGGGSYRVAMGTTVANLLKKAMSESGLDRRALVAQLPRTNRSKSFRRLDGHLSGETAEPNFLKEVGEVLGIPLAQIETVLDYERRLEEEEYARRREEEQVRWFERTGPHLWIVLPRGYHPSLITILGPAHFLLIPVPAGLAELSDYEQFAEIGAIIRAHYAGPRDRVTQIAGYRYRRSLDETFEFSTEGEFLGRLEGPRPTSEVVLRVRGGGRAFRRILGLGDC